MATTTKTKANAKANTKTTTSNVDLSNEILDDTSLLTVGLRMVKRSIMTVDSGVAVLHNTASAMEVLSEPLVAIAENQSAYMIRKHKLNRVVKFSQLLKSNKKLVEKYGVNSSMLTTDDLEDWELEIQDNFSNNS